MTIVETVDVVGSVASEVCLRMILSVELLRPLSVMLVLLLLLLPEVAVTMTAAGITELLLDDVNDKIVDVVVVMLAIDVGCVEEDDETVVGSALVDNDDESDDD